MGIQISTAILVSSAKFPQNIKGTINIYANNSITG